MKFTKMVIIAIGIQLPFILIATLLTRLFPSLNNPLIWMFGVTAGMFVEKVLGEKTWLKDETPD